MLAAAASFAAPVPIARFGWDSDASAEAARACAAIWQEEGPGLAAALLPPDATPDTITVLIVGTAEFERLFAGAIPDWGVGVAGGGGRVVAVDRERLPAVGRGVGEVFRHEMVHALTAQAAGDVAMPAWFLEGTAQLLSGEWRFIDTVSLVFDGRVPELGRLRSPFPADPHRADRAYRTSLLAVRRLEQHHGPGAPGRIIAAAAAAGTFEAGFAAATGEPLGVFERSFDAAMRLRFGWLAFVTSWPTLFVLLAVIMGVGGVRHLRAARRRLEAMDDGAAPLPGDDPQDPASGS